MLTDKEIVERLISGDENVIKTFLFEDCRPALQYIGECFFTTKHSPEELVGELYEVLAEDNWRRIRQFGFKSKLTTYVTVIATRHFMKKREKEIPADVSEYLMDDGIISNEAEHKFILQDIDAALNKLDKLDRFLVKYILLMGYKPCDVINISKRFFKVDGVDDDTYAGYIYVRYYRAKNKFKQILSNYGYGL